MTIVRFAGGGEYGERVVMLIITADGTDGGGLVTVSTQPVEGRAGSREANVDRIVIIGAGPAGYEAALVAAQLDADVTVVEPDGAGGAGVLSDCGPSKTFIASSDVVTGYRENQEFGVSGGDVTVHAAALEDRVKRLAVAQSHDIHQKLLKAGVTYVTGTARFGGTAELRHAH